MSFSFIKMRANTGCLLSYYYVCFVVRGRSGREEVVKVPFHHPVTVMQCDVTTNVADAITNVGNPNESSEMLSNYRGGTTASARVRYKHLRF